jgi:hypothetical protein
MKRQEQYKMKLKAARAELTIRNRILAAAQRGVDKVLKIIDTLENKLK